MKSGAHITVAAARLYVPLIAFFAFTLFADRVAGGGVGFVAGLAFGLAIALHALVFGAAAARAALPPFVARLIGAVGTIAAVAGAGLPALQFAPQLLEAGVFATTIAAEALVIQVLFGRASALRDAEW